MCRPAWFGTLQHYVHDSAHVGTTCMVWHTLRQGGKRKVIRGDGTCSFRALAHIAYGTENNYATMRQSNPCSNFMQQQACLPQVYYKQNFWTTHCTSHQTRSLGNSSWAICCSKLLSTTHTCIYFPPLPKIQQLLMAAFWAWASSQLFNRENSAAPLTNLTMTHIELSYCRRSFWHCAYLQQCTSNFSSSARLYFLLYKHLLATFVTNSIF